MKWVAAALIGLGLFASSGTSTAATLSVSHTVQLYLSGIGVVASTGGDPIPRDYYFAPDNPVLGGSMDLDVGSPPPTTDVQLSFDFSLFSDEAPLVLIGTYGAGVPVVLTIHELAYQSGPTAVDLGFWSQEPNLAFVTGPPTGTLRGTLAVGSASTAFEIHSTTGFYTDGFIDGMGVVIDEGWAALGVVPLYGPEYSSLGAFPATDLLTVDGVTFGLPELTPSFLGVYYVPEPGAAPLAAVALGLLLRRRRRRAQPVRICSKKSSNDSLPRGM